MTSIPAIALSDAAITSDGSAIFARICIPPGISIYVNIAHGRCDIEALLHTAAEADGFIASLRSLATETEMRMRQMKAVTAALANGNGGGL